MIKQHQRPYSFNRGPTKREKVEENAGKTRDGVMVPAELRGRVLSPEEVAAATMYLPKKPPGKP